MFNPKIFKNNKVWYLILAVISLSYPLQMFNKFIFLLMIMCVFLISPFFISKLLHQDFRKNMEVEIYISWIKALFYSMGIFIMALFVEESLNPNNQWIVITFCWLMFGVLLIWLVDNLLILTKHLRRVIRKEERSKKSIYFCVLIVLVAFIATDLTFGYGYKFFFSVLYNIEFQNFLEIYYLSFVVAYTLPVSNEKLMSYIDLINKEFVLYTYQMVQVYFKKIIDIVLIALIVGFLQDLIKENFKNTVK